MRNISLIIVILIFLNSIALQRKYEGFHSHQPPFFFKFFKWLMRSSQLRYSPKIKKKLLYWNWPNCYKAKHACPSTDPQSHHHTWSKQEDRIFHFITWCIARICVDFLTLIPVLPLLYPAAPTKTKQPEGGGGHGRRKVLRAHGLRLRLHKIAVKSIRTFLQIFWCRVFRSSSIERGVAGGGVGAFY